MVTITKINDTWNRVFVVCPITGCGTLIARDRAVWIHHMENQHSASSSSWDTVNEQGGEQDGIRDFSKEVIVRYANRCYGCGATFSTKALLIAHLSSIHSAT